MDIVTALAPIFAAGLGIQQLGEILSPLIDKISPNYKKVLMGLVSLVLGLILAKVGQFHLLQLLGAKSAPGLDIVDTVVTGFIISGGTEGINSILKFLKYKKEDVKNEAAAKTPESANAAHAATVPVATTAALTDLNKK